MNCFTKYVLRQLFVGMVLVTLGLTTIIWLSQSLRFMEMIVNRGLSAEMFVYLTVFLWPSFLALVVALLGYALNLQRVPIFAGFFATIYWQWGSRQRHAEFSPVPM